jgi:hypothetical protein
VTLDSESLTGLTSAVRALLPEVAAPILPLGLGLAAAQIVPLGLGDFVGTSADPAGSITGRRVRATLAVTVTTTDASRLDAAVANVTAALITGDPAARRAQGLLQVSLDDLSDRVDASGTNPPSFRRDVRFKVLYEHLRLPEAGEYVIETIPTDVQRASALQPSD